MYLTKVNNNNYNFAVPEIQEYLLKNLTYKDTIAIDMYRNISKNNYVINFCNIEIRVNINSFIQNHNILARKIRKYVLDNIYNLDITNILCIGGESYMYGIYFKKFVYHYTNNKYIHEDFKINYNYGINNFVDYNKLKTIESCDVCIINLSNLNSNVLKLLNNNCYKLIVIINCDYNNFWKRIKLLSNYNIISRKQFVCEKLGYFVTVSIFKYKYKFISLGSTCAVSYNIKKILQQETYPFDWCKIKLNQLENILSQDFKDFENIEIYKFSENHLYNDKTGSYILRNKYNVTFAHEVLEKYELNEFKKRLIRRIKLFKKLENPIFIRFEINDKKYDYSTLLELLSSYFSDYRLIIISKNEPLNNNDKIIYHKLNNFSDNWKYENINWKNILK